MHEDVPVLGRGRTGLEMVEEGLLRPENLNGSRREAGESAPAVSFNTKTSSQQWSDECGNRGKMLAGKFTQRVLHSVKSGLCTSRALGPFLDGPPFSLRRKGFRKVNGHSLSKVGWGFAGCHRTDVGRTVLNDRHGEKQPDPFKQPGFHGQVRGSQFLASSNQMLEATVGVAGRRLDAFNGQS